MNNKRVKKVRKILLKNYSNLLDQLKNAGFIDRIKYAFIIVFRLSTKEKFSVIKKG
jgi:hypothetical protein